MEIETWHVWLIAAILFFIIEVLMTNFVAVCIGIGALITGIVAFGGLSITQQLLLFTVFTLLLIFFIRPFAKKFIFKDNEFVSTNSDALLGKEATVVESIDENKLQGRIEIDGDNWKAVSFDGKPIMNGQIVTVVCYDSIVLTVK